MGRKQSTNFVWFDGSFRSKEHAAVDLLNHSLHYGSAVFEGIRAYDTPRGPAVFRLKDHVARLFHSAEVMGMRIPYTRKAMAEAIRATVRKNKLRECYIRPIVYYEARMGLLPQGASVHVAIAAWPWEKYLDKDEVRVMIVRTRRLHPESGVMTAKVSGHYYNSILAGLEAHRAGFDEALLLDWRGYIAEGPGENIFFVQGKTLYTPRADAILPGITRQTIMTLAQDLGLKVVERDIKPNQLRSFQEAFFCGTAVEVHPIARIDNVRFRSHVPGSVSQQLRDLYHRTVRGDVRKHAAMLFEVDGS